MMPRALVAAVLAAALAGCAQLQSALLPSRGVATLSEGIRYYNDGQHGAAVKSLESAVALGLGDVDRGRAYKFLAFIHCGAGQIAPCRDDFRNALAADPALELAPAEAGHPTWGPIFREAKVAANPFGAGLKQFNDGDYDASAKSLQGALERGLPPKDQVVAYKYLAFIHCANNRVAACRDEFRKALTMDPALELTAAEAGHPVWGPLFRSLKGKK
jgi:Tfp pilus assembly protein PilF